MSQAIEQAIRASVGIRKQEEPVHPWLITKDALSQDPINWPPAIKESLEENGT
jgi:hypothetical protein